MIIFDSLKFWCLQLFRSIGICDSFCALIYCDRKTTIQELETFATPLQRIFSIGEIFRREIRIYALPKPILFFVLVA